MNKSTSFSPSQRNQEPGADTYGSSPERGILLATGLGTIFWVILALIFFN
jgi:hypothetical protein